MQRTGRYSLLSLALLLLLNAWGFAGASSTLAQEGGTVVYDEDFAEGPNYTIAISDNIQGDSEVYWDEGPENFYAKIATGNGTPLYAVGMSPTFSAVQPEDGFSISFQFNPVSYTTYFGSSPRAPGLYFVESGGTDNPQEKTRAFEFTAPHVNDAGERFRLLSASGDEFATPLIPARDERYEITLTYNPASQTVDIEILRQDGSVFVDQRAMSMEITNAFDQVLIGEISNEDGQTAEIRVDDIEVRTNVPYPAPPEKLTASASDQQAVLSWLASPPNDVAGYNVYRSTQSFDEIGDATKVNGSLLNSPGFTDTGLNNGTAYYYRTTVVDTDGNESNLSAETMATPLVGGTVVYSESFVDDPGHTVVYSGNAIEDNRVSWDEAPQNFYANIDVDNEPQYAVGMSPIFPTVQPEDGFSISLQFNPVSYTTYFGSSQRAPGLYFVEAGGTDNPKQKTESLRFTAPHKNDQGEQFRLLSASGDEYLTPIIPARDEQYEVTLTYNPASQTVDIEILRQDGSVFVDQRAVSMEITNPFDQVLIGELSDGGGQSAEMRVDDIEVQTNAPYPAPPEKLTASASDQQVVLSWLPSPSSDVAGYNVYRSIQSFDEISDATKANGALLNSPGFTDTGLNNGTAYYYRTTVVDTDGNESNLSAETMATPLMDGTVVYSESFADDPGHTVVYTDNAVEDNRVSWDETPENFYASIDVDDEPQYAVGMSPTFSAVQPEDGFSISLQFNPVSYTTYFGSSQRAPGLYFVEAGGTDNPKQKTKSLRFTAPYKNDAGPQFRLLSASGDEYVTPVLPAEDERYEVSLTYNPASQTVDIKILRQDGSVFVDQQDVSVEITNPFDQVLIGELSDGGGQRAEIRIDDIEVRTDALPPEPPSNLSAQGTDEQVTLTWADTTNPDLEAYWVYRGTTAEFDTTGARIAMLDPNTSQYEDTNVANGTTYFYRALATSENGFVGELSSPVNATPKENLLASVSETVSSDGAVNFGATGMDIVFSDVDGSGTVTVEKFSDAPENIEGISESNVSSYRHVITADGNLTFGSNTEVRLDVNTLDGISDATNVTIYKRPDVGTGSFSELTTNYDADANELVATTGSFSEFALASNSEPLPVELTDFEAEHAEGSVRLTWRTASERDNARFEVQRRAERRDSWQQVGSVQSKAPGGTTTEPQSYRFTDADLPYAADSLTYRLRQVDLNGTTRLTEAVTVRRQAQELELLGAFPNPARGQATVRFAVPKRQAVTLRVYDVLGRQVRTPIRGKREGRHEMQVNLSDLPSGTYFLRLRAENAVKTTRLTVVR